MWRILGRIGGGGVGDVEGIRMKAGAHHTVREYAGGDGYVARRDIPPLWTDEVGLWRRLWEGLKAWAHGEGVRG